MKEYYIAGVELIVHGESEIWYLSHTHQITASSKPSDLMLYTKESSAKDASRRLSKMFMFPARPFIKKVTNDKGE